MKPRMFFSVFSSCFL